MARALVKINGTDSQFRTVAIGSTVSLSNHDEGGELAYLWAIADQPEGTADVLSATGVENVSFVPTKEGSYELRLVVNATLATQAIQTAIVAVLDARTNERIPAATETTETGVAKGWALSASRILSRTLHASVDGNLVIAQTPGGLAAGAIVILTGLATINAGTQAVFTVPRLAAALGTVGHRERLGIVIDGVAPGDLSALVQVRMFGLVPFNGTGSPAVGALVFLSDAGQAALTAGTVPRQIGYVVAASGGSYQWVIDTSMGGRKLGEQKFTASGTYTPTPGTTLAIAYLTGGGAAGGSAQGAGSGSAVGGGGSSGVTIRVRIPNPVVGAVTIGAAGAPGATGNNPGGNGGDTLLVQGGTTFTAKGGGGGAGMANGGLAAIAGGIPQSGSSAADWIAAEHGQRALTQASSTWTSGSGGGGARGIGGAGQIGTIAAALVGSGNGAGGAGAAVTTTSAAGAAGTIGLVLIEEFS